MTRAKVRARPGDKRGFIHKRIGRVLGRVGTTALSVVGAAGIPGVSTASRFARSFAGGGSRSPQFVGAAAAQTARFQQSRFNRGRGPVETQAEAANFAAQLQAQGGTPTPGAACPKGFHLNKSTYRELRSGNLVVKGTKCVPNRRRNPDNGSAAMRAARRLLSRKRHQDRIDKALRAIAPRRSGRRSRTVSTGSHIHT